MVLEQGSSCPGALAQRMCSHETLLVPLAPRIGELRADISNFLLKLFAFFFLAVHPESGYCKSARLGWLQEADISPGSLLK